LNKKIFCTLGPATLNKKFLSYSQKNIDLLRINMSHINLKNLENTIKYIRKYTTTPICIDTEGAQIRTKIKKKIFLKKNKIFKINFKKGNLLFYPEYINRKLKKNDVLELGFSGLEVKIVKKNSQDLVLKVIKNGLLETNKGVHLKNRKIKIDYLTDKDLQAIKIAKKYKIKNFALSFTNSVNDIKKFNLMLKKERKIFKLETKQALKEITDIIKEGENFLIDRGDLSKDIKIENIPIAQRKIIQKSKKAKKKVYVATNFLESMINESSPTRGEVNDIYSTLEQGANGLVLAAETAIGKYPIECVEILKRIIKNFNKKF
jgi:pyruvate kinase